MFRPRTMLVPLLAAPFVLLAAPPAPAQEAIGEIVADLDGEARTWRTYVTDDPDVSYNTGLEDWGGTVTVGLHGYEDAASPVREVLVIDLTLSEGAAEPMEQTVLYVADSMTRPWASIAGEPVVTVEAFDPEGRIEGRLSGRLCFRDGMFAEPDPDRCKVIEGRFASDLPRQDG